MDLMDLVELVDLGDRGALGDRGDRAGKPGEGVVHPGAPLPHDAPGWSQVPAPTGTVSTNGSAVTCVQVSWARDRSSAISDSKSSADSNAR